MKSKNKLIIGLTALMVILYACDDKNNDQPTPRDGTDYSGSVVDGLKTIEANISSDQIKCNISIDSLHPHILNNFASHIEIPLGEKSGVYSIFNGISSDEFGYIYPLNPILEFVKDEQSVKKIIASWNKDSINAITDSIYLNVTKIDTNYHDPLNYTSYSYTNTTIIYINLLNINRYGYAKINFDNSQINNYLLFDLNSIDNQESNITITPQDFREKYGDAFCSSLLLGTVDLFEGVIYGVNAPSGSRNDALEEAVEMVKLYISEEKEWKELVANSKYFKNSIYIDYYSKSNIGYSGEIAGNYNKITNTADRIYQLGKFNQYSSGFKLYSDIYHNYDFIDVDFSVLK